MLLKCLKVKKYFYLMALSTMKKGIGIVIPWTINPSFLGLGLGLGLKLWLGFGLDLSRSPAGDMTACM